MKVGARNQLKGTVEEIKKDKVMCQVKVRLPDGAIISSVMTRESLDEMELKKGCTVTVLTKAVNVLLLKE
jgi:molybdopterin-binding protein